MAAYTGRGLHGQTVETLGQRIVGGGLGEGETIDVAALRDELDLSVTAIREALRVLAAKGLVDARQKRGTYVLPRAHWNLLDDDVARWQLSGTVDRGLLRDLHEVRAIVEPAAAELAAARRSEADLAELDAALARMATAVGPGSADDAVAADLAFHRTLLAASHNELLARMEVLIEAGLAQRDRLVHSAEPGHDPVPAHRNVLEAIRRQDAAAARRAVDALLVTSAADLARLHPATRLPEASEPSGIPVDAP